jgi:hypothetical protein
VTARALNESAPEAQVILDVLGDRAGDRLLWIGASKSSVGRSVAPQEVNGLAARSFDPVVVERTTADSYSSDSARAELLSAATRACAEGGTVCVAASNLNWLPAQLSLRVARSKGFGALARAALRKLRNRSALKLDDVKAARISPDGLSRAYAIKPRAQLIRLEQLGVRDVRVFRPDGEAIAESQLSAVEDQWLIYAGRV